MQTKPVVNCKITLEFITIYINNPRFSEFHLPWNQGRTSEKQQRWPGEVKTGAREAVLQPGPVLAVCKRHRVASPQLHTRCSGQTSSGVHCSSTILRPNSIIRSKCYVLIKYSTCSQWKVNKCQTFKKIQKFDTLKRCIDVTTLFTLISIHKNVYHMLLLKSSMFHENDVNSVKCFHYITKGEKSVFHVVLGKELR